MQRQGFSLIGKKMSKIQCSEHRIKGKISVCRDVMSKGMLWERRCEKETLLERRFEKDVVRKTLWERRYEKAVVKWYC